MNGLALLARLPLWCWFLAGAAPVAAAQVYFVSSRDWNATALLQVGHSTTAWTVVARDFPNLWVEPTAGHDGKYNYLIARHPAFWRAAPETVTGYDGAGYRYTRILYPLLAGLGGALSPAATLTGLIAVQVLAGGAVATLLAMSARRQSLSAWFVAANLFNQGVYGAAVLLTSDLTAHALALAGWACAEAWRVRWAAALFALALLAKEYYALTPLALAAAFALERRWRDAAVIGVLPLLPALAWKAAVTAGLGVGGGAGNFTWPGGGIVAAWEVWDGWNTWIGVLGVALLAATLAVACVPRLPLRLRLAAAAWGALGLVASGLVWGNPTDLLRVILPAWWLVAWAAFIPRASPGGGRTG